MSTRRLDKIFRADGRTLICAMDHTGIFGPGKGLEKPGETLEKVVAAGVDAVMTSFGIAQHFTRELAPVGLVLRADGAPTIIGEDIQGPIWFGVEEALRIGADALCISAYPGGKGKELESLNNLAQISREAKAWGLALMAEMVPGGMGAGPEFTTMENVRLAARLGQELGGDWSKVSYVPEFEKVTAACFKPVVILGGSKRSDVELLKEMRSAMDKGGAGGTIGRNIFEHDDPEAMARALVAIIHDDASYEEAVAILRRE